MDHGLEMQIIRIQFNVLIVYDVCDKCYKPSTKYVQEEGKAAAELGKDLLLKEMVNGGFCFGKNNRGE